MTTWPRNQRIRSEGLQFLQSLPDTIATIAVFDPQYRGVLDHLSYGNEGKQRGQKRSALPQMTDTIPAFLLEIHRVLKPSGHLLLWIDKYHLCTGIQPWLSDNPLAIVDMITWNKLRIGMGYRTRRTSEYLMILQKPPKRAKGIWQDHAIPDVWEEKRLPNREGVHPKPVGLQSRLIEAVSQPGDLVIDPAAGSFSVLQACRKTGRAFLGCDLNG